MFIEIPANKQSIGNRKLVHGVGINDAPYKVNYHSGKKLTRCPFYTAWTNMLKRCYSLCASKNDPTYADCYVCDEWLLFTNFKDWMKKQNWNGKELDKDVIIPGNKIYHPSGCAFVDGELNSLLCDSAAIRGDLPIGVSLSKRTKKEYRATIKLSGKKTHIGRYNSASEANKAYVKEKVKYILSFAEKQTDNRLRNGLILHAKIIGFSVGR